MDIRINSKYKFTGGDEISHYDASFEENPTLYQFVCWVLRSIGEWGYIEDRNTPDPKHLPYNFPKKIVEYRYGKIIFLCDDYDQLKDKKIALTNMDGGWSRMDYTIKFID